jgi:hypothetical protein
MILLLRMNISQSFKDLKSSRTNHARIPNRVSFWRMLLSRVCIFRRNSPLIVPFSWHFAPWSKSLFINSLRAFDENFWNAYENELVLLFLDTSFQALEAGLLEPQLFGAKTAFPPEIRRFRVFPRA